MPKQEGITPIKIAGEYFQMPQRFRQKKKLSIAFPDPVNTTPQMMQMTS
jgi:hypothetical protein